ncbi:MAG: response regulator [Terrimicrobiaceae bacterium]|nr:response regulator [Terrimicrobiaceae bacterium]
MTSLTRNPILVVDDEQTIRLGFSVALRSAGFDVEVAVDGSEAVELAMEINPDCILLDLRMPGLDGLQTAETLRAAGFCGPIVLASAFADHSTAVAAIGAGITDFLTKPIKPTELRYAVNHALSRHVRFSRAAYADPADIPPGLARSYAKYCLSQRRRSEAMAVLRGLTGDSSDLQCLLLLGAIYELEGDIEGAGEIFVRAADLRAHSVPIASSTELFKVFSHSDHRSAD